MDNINPREFLFTERYRPQTIEQCILPTSTKSELMVMAKKGQIGNLLFCGPAGVGKTSAAKALCNELGADVMFINASLENGIDVLRSKIMQFASTVSLTEARKVVILDEADYTNPQSLQPALRGFIEEFSENVRFILTCNYKHKIIEPLHSRCAVIDFNIPKQEKPELIKQFYFLVADILKRENIQADRKVLGELIQKHFPDFRRVINEIQRYSVSGTIDSGILINLGEESINNLFALMKDKNFTEVRKWVTQNTQNDSTHLFRQIYDKSATYFQSSGIPPLILILSEYSHRAAFVSDQEINIMACLVEIMAGGQFK